MVRMRVISANVNGIRAAVRRGGLSWLAAAEPDVLCLQEVRASDAQLTAAVADSAFAGWHVAHAPCGTAGRAGVAVLSRTPHLRVRCGLEDEAAVVAGRWVEAELDLVTGPVTVVSVYVHTGEAETPRQEEKYRFLDAMTLRMKELADGGRRVVVTGDLNIAHTRADLRNWKGNLGKAGFLPLEQAYLDRWLGSGEWVDVSRRAAGEVEGPYTWWSWRGKAFDNDTGWRIDYQLASAALAGGLRGTWVGRAATYAERWSDHAAVVADYDPAAAPAAP
jgi:exodeoxyribonuclease-3